MSESLRNSAYKPLKLRILPRDIACAIRNDEACCVISQAATRLYSKGILRITTGVQRLTIVRETTGRNVIVETYHINKEGRDALLAFDEPGGKWPKGLKVLTFTPVAPETIAAQRENQRITQMKKQGLSPLKPQSQGGPNEKRNTISMHSRVVKFKEQRKKGKKMVPVVEK
jgi:hypothetical protein